MSLRTKLKVIGLLMKHDRIESRDFLGLLFEKAQDELDEILALELDKAQELDEEYIDFLIDEKGFYAELLALLKY